MKVITFYANQETGELSRVAETDGFINENTLFRADVLKDIRDCAEALYAEAVQELHEEWARKGATVTEDAHGIH